MHKEDELRIKRRHQQLIRTQRRMKVLADEEARDCAHLHERGVTTYGELGRVLGVSRGRAQQIVEKGNRLDG